MSVDFNIYVLTRHPDQDEVLGALGDLGLSAHFLASWDSLEIQAPGAVAAGVVAGFQLSDGPNVSSALKERDKPTLDALYSKEALALVTVSIDHSFELTPEFERELEQSGVARDIRTSLKHATAVITLRTTARASDLSLEFQRSLWASMGVTCGAILEDPEESEFIDGSKA